MDASKRSFADEYNARSILLHSVFTMRSVVVLFYMHLQEELTDLAQTSQFSA